MLRALLDPICGKPIRRVPNLSETIPPIAGFDLTFSPLKSVSIALGLGDEKTREIIYSCHRKAIDFVLEYGKHEVFHSRSGINGKNLEGIKGVIATSFTHYDPRFLAEHLETLRGNINKIANE